MEAPPLPPAPPPSNPPPPPPHDLPSALARLRSLLSAASSALAALPTPLQPRPTSPHTGIPSPPPATAATPPLPPPATAVTLPLPAAPAPYSDCPAVVRTTPTPIPSATSLPAFIAAECADFSSSRTAQSPSQPPRILPSELGLLRRELDSWGAGGHHFPGSYSHTVTRVAAAFRFGLTLQCEAKLRQWVLGSSTRYEVKVDVAEADHIWVLLWLCLKVMAAEAGRSLEGIHNGDGDRGGVGFDPRAMRFECPRLVEGVSWLGTQLGVLYGERNGRLFALAAVKEAVLQMAYCLAVGVGDGVAGGGEGEFVAGGGAGAIGSNAGGVVAGPVFLSQVAAAIMALYGRFSLEKTKALQAQRLSKYQLLLEYSQALERGDLERSNRPNFRAILEYDGILSRRVENQESARAKTKEELLAEERDYKRRRASYRGKKVNRNPTEVLRDIIDEHMEEIKQAGGIGCLVEGPADIQNVLKSNSHGSVYQGSYDFSSSSSHGKAALRSRSSTCDKSPHSDSLGRFSSRSRDTRDSYKTSRYETDRNRYKYVSEDENRWSLGSESEIDQSYPYQEDNHRRQRSSNDNRNRSKYNKGVSDHRPESSDCSPWSARSQRSSVTEYAHMSGEGHIDRSRASQKRHRSLSVTQDQFSDRYDPQSTYSDGDPEGKRKISHDEEHHRRHHDRKRDHHH